MMKSIDKLDYGGKYGVICRINQPYINRRIHAKIIRYIKNIIYKYDDITYIDFLEDSIHIWGGNTVIVDNFKDIISNKLLYILINQVSTYH